MRKEIKQNKFWVWSFKMIFVFLFIVCSLIFFFYIVGKEKAVTPKAQVSQKTAASVVQYRYYIKMKDNHAIVYRTDHTVFEYTDLNQELLPESLKKELLAGKYFYNEEELYEFLETYTS